MSKENILISLFKIMLFLSIVIYQSLFSDSKIMTINSMISNILIYTIILLSTTKYIKQSFILTSIYLIINYHQYDYLFIFMVLYMLILLYILFFKIEIKFQLDMYIENFYIIIKLLTCILLLIMILAISFGGNPSLNIILINIIILVLIFIPYNIITKKHLLIFNFFSTIYLLLLTINNYELILQINLLMNLYFLIYYIVRHFYDKDKEKFEKFKK